MNSEFGMGNAEFKKARDEGRGMMDELEDERMRRWEVEKVRILRFR